MLETPILKITLSRLIRYTYGGLLTALLAAIAEPTSIASIVGALGTILAPLAAVGLGTGVYIIHRHVLGETILFPLTHRIHAWWDRVQGHTEEATTSTIGYLKVLGVQRNIRSAYTAFRDQFFDPSLREKLDIQHSELHVLWITAELTLIAAVYLASTKRITGAIMLLILCVLAILSVIVADIRQHQMECHLMRTTEHQQVISFLQERGFLQEGL
jgi:Na+-translocating ferredoxin:NAD+ oxidoreductase RnfD subunit